MQYKHILEKIDVLDNACKHLSDNNQKPSRRIAFECLEYLNEIDKIMDEVHEFINKPIKTCTPYIINLIISKCEKFEKYIKKISELLAECIVDLSIYNEIDYSNDFRIVKFLKNDFVVIKNPILEKDIVMKIHLYLFCVIKNPAEIIKKKFINFRENCLYKVMFRQEIDATEKVSLIYLKIIKVMLESGINIGCKLNFPVEEFLVAQKFFETFDREEEEFNLYRLISHEMSNKTFISIYKYPPKKVLFMVQKIIDQVILLDSFNFNISVSVLGFNYELANDFKRQIELQVNRDENNEIINLKVDDLYNFEPRVTSIMLDNKNENIIVS